MKLCHKIRYILLKLSGFQNAPKNWGNSKCSRHHRYCEQSIHSSKQVDLNYILKVCISNSCTSLHLAPLKTLSVCWKIILSRFKPRYLYGKFIYFAWNVVKIFASKLTFCFCFDIYIQSEWAWEDRVVAQRTPHWNHLVMISIISL